jgi:hypothetical protein
VYIFIGFGTEKYSAVIFIGTEEYKEIKKDTLFLCSACLVYFIGWLRYINLELVIESVGVRLD